MPVETEARRLPTPVRPFIDRFIDGATAWVGGSLSEDRAAQLVLRRATRAANPRFRRPTPEAVVFLAAVQEVIDGKLSTFSNTNNSVTEIRGTDSNGTTRFYRKTQIRPTQPDQSKFVYSGSISSPGREPEEIDPDIVKSKMPGFLKAIEAIHKATGEGLARGAEQRLRLRARGNYRV